MKHSFISRIAFSARIYRAQLARNRAIKSMGDAITTINALAQPARQAVANWVLRHERQHDHSTWRFILLAWVGCLGMPLYYVVWTYWFPQEFESLALRAIGVALCLPAPWAHKVMPQRWRQLYLFSAVTYVLPFFFTFMYLMNHGAPVWAQSLLIALTVLFHFPLFWALGACLTGVTLACALFALADNPAFLVSDSVLEQLPLYFFTIIVVSAVKVGQRVLAQEKLAGMAQGLATVSHELRTPLLSVDANVRGLARRLARAEQATAAERAVMSEAMGRIQYEVRHMNHMIDLFLLSATAVSARLEPTELVSMDHLVEGVILRYPFASTAQRDSVQVELRGDFRFAGTKELAVVVLLNLLRNALKALHRAGMGRVRIIIDGNRAVPRLLFIDTGCGIAPQLLPRIFKRFYSYPASSGAGIGLALCKDILDAWQANIRCISRESAYTIFVLEFPTSTPAHARLATQTFAEQPPCSYPSTTIPA
jgi:two-component system CAI-1 autoinducer sensor kinase/phosphatase CqsS